MALHAEESEACGGCGQPLVESTDAGSEFAYEATAFRCHSCTAKEALGEKFKDEKPGIYVFVKKS